MNETKFAIVLKLTPDEGVFYNASVVPSTELERISDDTWQLIGSYNTSYNVSVVATLCEKYSTKTITIMEHGKFYSIVHNYNVTTFIISLCFCESKA